MIRLKKQIQDLSKDRVDAARLAAIEQKLSDDFIVKLVEMQVDQSWSDKWSKLESMQSLKILENHM